MAWDDQLKYRKYPSIVKKGQDLEEKYLKKLASQSVSFKSIQDPISHKPRILQDFYELLPSFWKRKTTSLDIKHENTPKIYTPKKNNMSPE